MKHTIELTANECKLIVTHCVVFGSLASTLKRMSNKPGTHEIAMTVDQINDLSGWLAAEANHCEDPSVEMELHELWEHFECNLIDARNNQ